MSAEENIDPLEELLFLTDKYSHLGINFDDLHFSLTKREDQEHASSCTLFPQGGDEVRSEILLSGAEMRNLLKTSGLCLACKANCKVKIYGNFDYVAGVYLTVNATLGFYAIKDDPCLIEGDLNLEEGLKFWRSLYLHDLNVEDVAQLYSQPPEAFKEEASASEDLMVKAYQTSKFRAILQKIAKSKLTDYGAEPSDEKYGILYRPHPDLVNSYTGIMCAAWGSKGSNISVLPSEVYDYVNREETCRGGSEKIPHSWGFKVSQLPSKEELEFISSVFNPEDEDSLSLEEVFQMAKNI